LSPSPAANAPAISAAPGVDHAMVMGALVVYAKKNVVNPMPKHTARSPLEICPSVAPRFCIIAMTMTNELKKPTKPVVIPAMADIVPCEDTGLGYRILLTSVVYLYIHLM